MIILKFLYAFHVLPSHTYSIQPQANTHNNLFQQCKFYFNNKGHEKTASNLQVVMSHHLIYTHITFVLLFRLLTPCETGTMAF